MIAHMKLDRYNEAIDLAEGICPKLGEANGNRKVCNQSDGVFIRQLEGSTRQSNFSRSWWMSPRPFGTTGDLEIRGA